MSADFDLARRQRPLLRMLEEDGRPPDRCPICEASALLERSGRFPEAWVDRVGESVDLEILARELAVGGPNGLKRSGNSWVGECPLCRGDAFNLTPKKGIWKCFKCDAAGGSIRLVEVIRSVDFPEAVRYLAQRAGIPIEYENERQRLRCSQPGCAASQDPLDEVGYLMHARQFPRPEACVVWLQEAGVKRGETHSPSLMMPGRRMGRWNDVIADGREGGDPATSTLPDSVVASPRPASAPRGARGPRCPVRLRRSPFSGRRYPARVRDHRG